MNTWICLLRGINVGGSNIIKMSDLRALLSDLGYLEPRTYIQSGNCVFRSSETDADQLAALIGQQLEQQHGLRPKLMIMQSDRIDSALENNPYRTFDVPPKAIHVFFLSQVPPKADVHAMETIRSESERFHLDGDIFYLLAPEGIGRSKLAAKAEALIGVPATGRNLATVQKVAELSRL